MIEHHVSEHGDMTWTFGGWSSVAFDVNPEKFIRAWGFLIPEGGAGQLQWGPGHMDLSWVKFVNIQYLLLSYSSR